MFRVPVRALIGAVVLSMPMHVASANDETFVKTFAEVCIPERLNHEATLSLARELGWQPLETGSYPEFDRLAALADEALKAEIEAEPELLHATETSWLVRDVDDQTYLLAVNLLQTEVIDTLGCYLYDLSATAPMNPDLVSQMLNQPIAYSTDRSLPGFEPYREVNPAVMVMTVWGPSPDLPRTLDTQLMFIPVDSPAASELGFSGRVLSFSTSLPSWDERQETSAK